VSLVYSLDHRHDLNPAALAELIGGKAASLAVMAGDLGLPVPPGFAITTEACREFLTGGWPAGLDDELRPAMERLGHAAGRRFGDGQNPLLVSVRSGAPVSMPGMMDTILDLGLNDATTRGLAKISGDAAFAADCRRRFVEMFTRITGAASVPDDPWLQLKAAIEAVFRSWNSDRARAYRSREGIADDLGTAVPVQAMVFGNLGADSATGVLFTRNPATGEPGLYGDVMFAAQGEDVVAGAHRTEALDALETRLPQAGVELRQAASALERHLTDLCDIEFTVEEGKLWLLQVRVGKRSPRAALRIAVDMAEDPDFPLTRAQAVERVAVHLIQPPRLAVGRDSDMRPLATGLPASPGMATGHIATTPADAVASAQAGRPVILVRSETSPEDVQGMARAAGVLTSRGGLASHAAVVARGWGIPAVVGADSVRVGEHEVDIAGRKLQAGDTITIDGDTGEIFAGAVPGTTSVAPEAATLLAWARELGLEIGAPVAEATDVSPGAGLANSAGVLRALMIKGSASQEAVGMALLTDEVQPTFEQLIAERLVEAGADGFALTAKGKAAALAQLAADQRSWGTERAVAALDAFQKLDRIVKETVTAWQLREVGGAQVLNDHADAAYDATVLSRLASLHEATAEWLSSMTDAPAGLRRYLARLDRALTAAKGGDQRFVASPRVDSYHGVWFELHEELILLAGRSRAEESAAGRA